MVGKGLTVCSCHCDNCRKPNCGRCDPCRNMKFFGGDGSRKERCRERRCLRKPGQEGRCETTTMRSGRTVTAVATNNSATPIAGRAKKLRDTTTDAEAEPPRPPQSCRSSKRIRSDKNNNSTTSTAGRSSSRTSSGNNQSSSYRESNIVRRNKCGKCPACRRDDCGQCDACLGKARFGGNGQDKRVCLLRRCHVLYPQQRNIEKEKEIVVDSGENDGSESEEIVAATAKSKRPPAKKPTKAFRAEILEEALSSSSTTSGDSGEEKLIKTAKGSTTESIPSRSPVHVGKPQTLTEYLSSLEQRSRSSDQAQDSRKPPPRSTTLYGLPIPNEAPANVCSGCLGARDDELEDEPVLLCDGMNCGREYHLQCCVPQLPSIPSDSEVWLCQDCSPDGSTRSLIEYLEGIDRAKSEFLDNVADDVEDPGHEFVQQLLRKDSQENGLRGDCRIPESEMARSGLTQSLALCDSLARTRGGNEGGCKLLAPDDYVGKPIRIYNAVGNQYHTGRIVDYRTRALGTEFLVRFTAGSDDRKTPHQHWITLEEHALAVGTTLVWAQIPAGVWNPAILWLRTARDLIPVQDLLNESEGEIHFVQDNDDEKVKSPFKTKHKVFSLARTFGASETFALVNVRDQAVDLFHQETIDKHRNNPRVLLPLQMAKAEHNAQQRVRAWRAMPQENPVGPAVLSSRDWYTLPPLIPLNASPSISSHAKLCPNILHGLDRSKILDQLQCRGIDSTKDVAASLSCELVPVNFQTIQAERMGRELR